MCQLQLRRIVGLLGTTAAPALVFCWSSVAFAEEPTPGPAASAEVQPDRNGTPAGPAAGPTSASANATPAPRTETLPPNCAVGKAADGSAVILCSLPPAPGAALTPTPPAPATTKTEWYGWQTLAVDAGSITTMIAISVSQKRMNGVGPLIGLTGYLIGGPIVHGANGNYNGALASLGTRVLLPFTLGGFGLIGGMIYAVGRGNTGLFDFYTTAAVGMLIGGAAGVLASIVVDASEYSFKKVPVKSSQAKRGLPAVQVLPTAMVTPTEQSVGLVGVF